MFESSKNVQVVLPNQYDFKFMIPWMKLVLFTLYSVILLIYSFKFGFQIKRKLMSVLKTNEFDIIYPSDITSVLQIFVVVGIFIYGYILFISP